MRNWLKEWAPVIGLMLLAGVLRFYELGAWPPGLYHDEAFYGLDALRVLAGERPLYFAANNGREPMFIYLVALSISWLGRSVYAVRLPAAVISVLTIPAMYWMTRQLFAPERYGRRVALLAAAFTTITLWPVHLGLIGFRAGLLPLFAALSIGAGARAYRSGRSWDWLTAGVIYGLSFYTYLASRFTPLALAAFLVVLLIARRGRRLWPGALIFAMAAAVTVAPLAITALNNWEVVMGRPGEVSIFNPDINHGDAAGTALRSVIGTLGMFNFQGDRIPRHNVPYRPVFDALVTIVFIYGLVRLILGALQKTRSAPAALPDFLQPDLASTTQLSLPGRLTSWFVLIWLGVMLMPTMLAEDAPHFLRAVGVLPVAMIVPAIGLDTLLRWFEARRWRAIGYGLAAGLLIASLFITVTDYSRYAVDPETAHAFEAAGTQLAAEARTAILARQRAVIADRFTRDWASVPFLLGHSYQPLGDDGRLSGIEADASYVLFLWPYDTAAGPWWQTLSAFPPPRTVRVTAGPSARGDLDLQPHVGYLKVQVDPQTQTLSPEAAFDNGVELLGHSIQALDNNQWRVQTLWRSSGAVADTQTFFVHLRRANALASTRDGDSGDGFYPLAVWRPGDVIIDERTLDVPAGADPATLLVEVGIYDRAGGQRAKVLTNTQAVIDNAILLGGPGAVGP